MPVTIENLPETVIVNGTILHRKSSFHVSLLCVKDIVAGNGIEIEQKLLNVFCSFVGEHNISLVSYLDEFRFAEDAERKTLVVRCTINGLKEFFSYIESSLGIVVLSQPTHVTLYTLQPNIGIGLNSLEAMESKSTQVQVSAEVKKILGIN